MNYGYITPVFVDTGDEPLDAGIDYDAPAPVKDERCSSAISTRSLCSALGSQMEIRAKSQHLFDATVPPPKEYEVPLHQIRGLRGLYRTGAISYAKDLKTKTMFHSMLRRETSAYRLRKERSIVSSKVRNTQKSQNKPFELYFSRERSLPAIHLHMNSSTPKPFAMSIPRIELHSPDECLKSSLPNPRLLRRPALGWVNPLSKDDPSFHKFVKTIDLKPKVFKTPQEQDSYYEDKYPLLLHANPKDAQGAPQKVMEKKPEVIEDPSLHRKLYVRSRLRSLQEAVDYLDKETDDCEFLTELRDTVFDPSTYPWNVPDVKLDVVPDAPPVTPYSSGSSAMSSPR